MNFSIRQLLLLIAPIAVYCACLASASRGGNVGFGLAVAVPSVVLWFLTMAVVCQVALFAGKLLRIFRPEVTAVTVESESADQADASEAAGS